MKTDPSQAPLIPQTLTLAQWTQVHERLARLDQEPYQLKPDWTPWMWSGQSPPTAPVLHLEDVSAIPFVSDVPGVEEYQHRARVRARSGDILASVTPAAPGYEAYCQEQLGLGDPELLVAQPVGALTQVAAACAQGQALARLVERARQGQGMTLHPYMGIEAVWSLARVIEGEAKAPVKVLGPTPQALWVANDKASLDRLVRALGLEHLLVETRIEREADAIAKAMMELGGRHRRVGLKRTRCASAMGNEVIAQAAIQAMSPIQALEHVERFMKRKECEAGEEVLVVQWADATDSPSTQLWIPPLHQGSPRLDGVYEQLLEGEERVFVGSRPATLPQAIQAELASASLQIAAALQALGYVGRCSFDFILWRGEADAWRIWLTECNGRWGGTSTPMSLVDRLVQGPRPAYIAQDVMHPALVGATLPELLERLGPDLFDPKTQRGRFILYNVGPLAAKGKLDVIALGRSPEDALVAMRQVLPSRWGLS